MMPLLPATLALTLAAAASPAKAPERLVLIDLDTTMVGMASQVTGALRDAAAAQKIPLVPIEELRTKLGPRKYNELVKCAGKPACVATALGDYADLTRAVSGSLAVDEKNYVLKLSLIDLKTMEVIADVDRLILIASRRFQKDVRDLAGPLLRGEREARGTLVVKTNAKDAQVTVNGEFVGVAPVTLQLKPGKHEVKVERSKYLPVSRLVDLEPNQTQTADIRMILKPGEKAEDDVPALVSNPTPGGSARSGFSVRPGTIVAGGATLVAFGIGTVFGIQSNSTEKRLLSGYDMAKDTYTGKRTEALSVHSNALIANVSFGVAGAALVATAVLLFFDVQASNAPVQVTPVAAPTGAGVVVGGRF